jgi:UDP-N-acetyl-D-mannosaminuronate dehydrogenase
VDPYYLSWKAREYDFYTKFIELAADVNSGMPVFTLHRIIEALNRQGQPLRGAKVLVLGAAFKRDIDDFRNSPSLALMRNLLAHGADVAYHDPHVPELTLDDEHGGGPASGVRLRSVPLTEQSLGAQDCVCLAVAHTAFDLPWLVKHARLIMDATGATRRVSHAPGTVVRL